MIKIITDAAADISKEIAEELGIEILPFMIVAEGRQIIADENLDREEFYDIIENSDEVPTTSQMSPSDIEDIYRRVGKDTPILHITMSGKASGTNNTANMVASQLNDEGFDIVVYDSTSFSLAFGKGVIEAARMAKSGKSREEIIDYITEVYTRDTAYFLVDDLTQLKKSGRIKATTMAISKALDIKPILTVNDGLVEAFRKIRGLKKALSALVDFIEERMDNPEENELLILHSRADDKVEIIEKMIRERVNPKTIEYEKIGPVITTHAGVGVLGVYFKHKKPFKEYENK